MSVSEQPPVLRTLSARLAGRQLVLISNREPYIHRRGDQGVKVDRPAGGLVAALDPVMQAAGGTWIAWGSGDADFQVADEHGRVRVPPDRPGYTLVRVPLPPAEVDGYYYGYANQALWPLCHMAMEHARFRRRNFQLYEAANQRFADAALREAGEEAIVWVHDYHLALVPRMLRKSRPHLFIMHFWHIPWPAWDVFRICPQSTELLEGLLGNDLIGFQHARDVEHFLDCAERELGARVDREENVIESNGRLVHAEAFPISVDFHSLDAQARSAAAEQWMARLARRYRLGGRLVTVGVDRLDYTKGIPQRLQALERLLERRPQYRGRLVFIQKSAPSRTQIRAYRELQRQVEEGIDRINATYGTADWRPVIHLPSPLPPAGMAALYRMADACVVSSLQDGMNLVGKEFIACQTDLRGTLVLSTLAGARDELSWAIPANPYDRQGFADAWERALEMPAEERRQRMIQLRSYVAEYDIYAWVERHLEAAQRLLSMRTRTGWLLHDLEEVRARLSARPTLAVLLDFDGTLATIAAAPDLVQLSETVREDLRALSRAPGTLVAIVSGRAVEDVRARVGIADLVYAGNHGLELAGPDWTWTLQEAETIRPAIGEICRRLAARLADVPGVLIEEKGLSASVHYRLTPHPRLEEVRIAVYEEASRLPPRTVTVRPGKRVLELRPDVAWDKGAAAQVLLRRALGEDWSAQAWVVYIGDDRTDEDAFRALAGTATTVKVGHSAFATAAQYIVWDVGEVHRFLHLVADWQASRSPLAP